MMNFHETWGTDRHSGYSVKQHMEFFESKIEPKHLQMMTNQQQLLEIISSQVQDQESCRYGLNDCGNECPRENKDVCSRESSEEQLRRYM